MAKKTESLLRHRVIQALAPLHAVAVENGLCSPGHPDLNYEGKPAWADGRFLAGHIETKQATFKSPTRQLAFSVEKFQRPWWALRQAAGGNVGVLLQVTYPESANQVEQREYLWFTGRALIEEFKPDRLNRLWTHATRVLARGRQDEFTTWLRSCVHQASL